MRRVVLRIFILIFTILGVGFLVLYVLTLKSLQDLVLFLAAMILLIVVVIRYDLHLSVLELFPLPKRKKEVRQQKPKKASFRELYTYDKFKSIRDDFEERFVQDDKDETVLR